jgi:hypothetical protein
MTTASQIVAPIIGDRPSGIQVASYAREAIGQTSDAILAYANGGSPRPPPPNPIAPLVSKGAPSTSISRPAGTTVAITELVKAGGPGGGTGGGGGGTYKGPFELGSDVINYGSNTSANILVQFRLPTGSVRDGNALVYLEPGSNGWCKFISWYDPNDPTDGRFYLHIGADFWHGGGNCVWVVNGYYSVIDPTP